MSNTSGSGVRDFPGTWERFERVFGLPPRDLRKDQGRGFQHDARVLLGNDCWLHFVYNWNPDSRVYQFVERSGPGLEHIALQTDDIEADVERLRQLRVPIFEDRIIDANDGLEAFVFPDDAIGFTVELIQPHRSSWGYPEESRGRPVSTRLGISRLSEIGAAVPDPLVAAERFEKLFGVRATERRIDLRNCSLPLIESSKRTGLAYLAMETATLEDDLRDLREHGVPVGADAVVPAEDGVGFTVKLVPGS